MWRNWLNIRVMRRASFVIIMAVPSISCLKPSSFLDVVVRPSDHAGPAHAGPGQVSRRHRARLRRRNHAKTLGKNSTGKHKPCTTGLRL